MLEHLDVNLSSMGFKEIKKHLDRCPNCDAYLDSVKKTIKLYRIIPHPHIARAVRRRLFSVVKFK